MDLLYLTFNGSHVYYSLNDGTGTFAQGLSAVGGEYAVVVADFTGDGYPDFAAVENSTTIQVGLSTAVPAVPRFTSTPLTVSGYLGEPAVADLNGDGNLDFLISNATTPPILNVFLNNGTGQFRPAPSFPLPAVGTIIVTGDFDNDGRVDVVCSSVAGGVLYFLRSLGGGTFAPAVPVSVSGLVPLYLESADFNGDGFLDVAVTGNRSNRVGVLLGNGTGQFTQGTTLTTSGTAGNVYAVDLNGDTRLDLAVLVPASNVVNLFFNQPAPLSTSPALAFSGLETYPNPVTTGTFSVRIPVETGQPTRAELRNVLGQVVHVLPSFTVVGSLLATTVDAHLLFPGLYTLCLHIGNRQVSRRVSIE